MKRRHWKFRQDTYIKLNSGNYVYFIGKRKPNMLMDVDGELRTIKDRKKLRRLWNTGVSPP